MVRFIWVWAAVSQPLLGYRYSRPFPILGLPDWLVHRYGIWYWCDNNRHLARHKCCALREHIVFDNARREWTDIELNMDANQELTIGKLADRSGVNVETIRYYQRLGLLREPPKSVQGFRRYPVADIARVRFIRRAQQLGFTLKEIGELLELGDGHCREVQQLARLKVEKIEDRLRDLQSMRAALLDLLSRCEAADTSDIHCALIEALGKEATIIPSGEKE